MKILYGVAGAGMGHAIRSSVVVDWLLDRGHRVHLVASGHAVEFLEERFPEVSEIWGLSLVMEDNEVKKRLTTAKNVTEALSGLPKNAAKFVEMERDFDPDLAISDFETWSCLFAKFHGIPVVALDNVQAINRCRHGDDILEGVRESFRMAKSVVKARCPGAARYLIPAFAPMELRKERTSLVPPVLRDRLLEAEPTDGDHLLVYQSSDSFPDVEELLLELDRPVCAYGVRPDVEEDRRVENVTFRPFSEEQFVEDLAASAGVVASAGFTLISEAFHLGKPYLATPIGDQFEQIMNARYVEKLGYGMYVDEFDGVALDAFQHRLERYSEALEAYPVRDNSETFEQLGELIEDCARGDL